MKEPQKPAIKSLTIWGIITTLAGALVAMIGIDPNLLNFLSDGVQLTDISAIVAVVGAIIAYFGRKRATGPLKGLIRSKD